MSIKTEIEEISSQNTTFPKIMRSTIDGVLVLYSGHGIGMVVADSKKHHIGYYSESWIMEMFEDFKGVIKITQE